MQIRFYYIDGISEIDTPYFSTLQAQETYFNNHYVSSMDYAFFPPYYTNIIPVGSDDLNFALNVNYLSFEYLGKTYYYFIENFEYVNENLINSFSSSLFPKFSFFRKMSSIKFLFMLSNGKPEI